MSKDINFDFCLEIDFDKNSPHPERVFNSLSKMIQTFQQIDIDLVSSIDSKIKPVILLEDIEVGSIKAWLRNMIESLDDDGVKNLDWKPFIGQYLLKGKKAIINFLDDKTTITDRKEVEPLKQTLLLLAEETKVMQIPTYSAMSEEKLLNNIRSIAESKNELTTKDKFVYKTSQGEEATFNLDFNITPETIESLVTKNVIENTTEMIVKLRKPDYLGDSKWEFRYSNKTFNANIEDTGWLELFHRGELDIRPGDALRVRVKTTIHYGYDNEVVEIHNIITNVIEIIKSERGKQEEFGL